MILFQLWQEFALGATMFACHHVSSKQTMLSHHYLWMKAVGLPHATMLCPKQSSQVSTKMRSQKAGPELSEIRKIHRRSEEWLEAMRESDKSSLKGWRSKTQLPTLAVQSLIFSRFSTTFSQNAQKKLKSCHHKRLHPNRHLLTVVQVPCRLFAVDFLKELPLKPDLSVKRNRTLSASVLLV